MQTSGDRSRREREDIDMRFHFFYGFLLYYSESMLLIDDEKSESAEPDILREEPMCTDDDIDLAETHLFEDDLHLTSMSHTSERSHTHSESSESLLESLSMLFCEDEKGRDHGDLHS